jgi:uncharacterized protein YnzC (UPF0291/DUF896 family)
MSGAVTKDAKGNDLSPEQIKAMQEAAYLEWNQKYRK